MDKKGHTADYYLKTISPTNWNRIGDVFERHQQSQLLGTTAIT